MRVTIYCLMDDKNLLEVVKNMNQGFLLWNRKTKKDIWRVWLPI